MNTNYAVLTKAQHSLVPQCVNLWPQANAVTLHHTSKRDTILTSIYLLTLNFGITNSQGGHEHFTNNNNEDG
jgi:hypothetical protein